MLRSPSTPGRVGVWMLGARGSVATTTIVGAMAVRAGLAERTGLVTMLPGLETSSLPGLDSMIFAGHDVSDGALGKRAEELAHSGVLPLAAVRALEGELAGVDDRIRPGVTAADERPQREQLAQVQADLEAFRTDQHLDQVVVVDVSSTEPPAELTDELADLGRLEAALDAGGSPLPPSALYALAAFRAGCPVVAFTPSPGVRVPAVQEQAERSGVPFAGSDGKTGETLVKTVLAPMFAMRALAVRSWSGINLLGGGDGQTLADPDAAASKTASKTAGVAQILGGEIPGPVHIDCVPDLGDWKTAWDHISFEGFLGTRMSMQFTWQGCDSALAAPLVIDLVRLIARAQQCGRVGPQPQLGFFFKDPVDSQEHRLTEQFSVLHDYCAALDGHP